MAARLGRPGRALDGEVRRLGAGAGEDDLPRLCPDRRSEALPCLVQREAGATARAVGGRGVAVLGGEVRQHRLERLCTERRRGGVIEVDRHGAIVQRGSAVGRVYHGAVPVAALILAALPDRSLFEVGGQPAVRRLADVAWSGGALPVVVVAADPDGAVAAALAGAPVTLAEPAPAEAGPAGRIARAIDMARSQGGGAEAVLLWPAFYVHVDPETVTSLIEAHGTARAAIIAPAYRGERGWPVLVPVALRPRLDGMAASLTPRE